MGEGRMSLQLREVAAGVARFEKTSELDVEPSDVAHVARKAGELIQLWGAAIEWSLQ